MKYLINRVSCYDKPPCEEAKEEIYIRIDIRNCDCPSKIHMFNGNKKLADKYWFNDGFNHRVENSQIKRDLEDKDWFIELNSIEEINKFVKKYGDIVIKPPSDSIFYKLEIYDDYRE